MSTFYAWSPYIVIFMAIILVVVLVLWAYNRRESRRYIASNLALEFSKLGLIHIADVMRAYSVGDYSGIARVLHELKTVIDNKGIPSLFDDMFWKLLKSYATDADRRARIDLELKNIVVTPSAAALQPSPAPVVSVTG